MPRERTADASVSIARALRAATTEVGPVSRSGRIIGVGVDVVDIASIEHNLKVGGRRWLRKVFTDAELDYAEQRPDRLASRLAGKEAVVKALGVGFRDGVSPRTIEIACDPAGAPSVLLHDPATTVAHDHGINRVMVSLSRDGGVAAAAAWALANDEEER